MSFLMSFIVRHYLILADSICCGSLHVLAQVFKLEFGFCFQLEDILVPLRRQCAVLHSEMKVKYGAIRCVTVLFCSQLF